MVPDQEDDKDSLGTPADEGSAEEEQDAEEQEPGSGVWAVSDGSDGDDEDSEYYLHRLDKLLRLDQTDKLPNLDLHFIFGKTAIDQSRFSIDEETFKSRLNKFIETANSKIPQLSDELVEFLFKRAVGARRYVVVWNIFVENTKDPALKMTRTYLKQELNRYVKIQSLLSEKKQRMPSWMLPWSECWVGALEEILGQIEGELRSAIRILDDVYNLRISATFECESHILWLEKKEIRKHIGVARKLEVILAAFAYAAMLLPEPNRGIDGIGEIDKYMALIKQRISRVQRSQAKRTEAMLFRLRVMFAELSGK